MISRKKNLNGGLIMFYGVEVLILNPMTARHPKGVSPAEDK